MKIELKRIAKKSLYTIGKIYVDGKYICDCIEDRDRGLTQNTPLAQIKKIKVPKETAIPSGTYTVTLNVVSPKFSLKPYYKCFCGGRVPRLLNVPGFDGILIHTGSSQNSSAGCIIVGENKVVGRVINSQACFEKLYKILKGANDKGEKITITIQ